ncbi:alpha-tocopherol transfer protein-related [Holotrichia oblita]|uniref:Alpha-tocopherol transfer protein-related n=1 Tax=Holotrichia oblita TaxID=644536 RepID=A0ACB9TV79_HOLOL|nr:alpha-tocopherol transfer protein-related [Holotrichia oblita]
MSTYRFTLNEADKNFAINVLNETHETRAKSLEEIKNWLIENPNICAKSDDLNILAFLRGCKFRLDKTKQKIQNYYEMRSKVPEWFANRDPMLPEIEELAKLGVFIPLRQFQDNKHVVIIRTAVHDPRKHKQDDVFKVGKMILDLLGCENEQLQIYGVIAIFDMQGISVAHARQLPPSKIKKAVHAWQNYHCRPKQLEFINAPVYINVLLNVFKRFMSEKLKGRVRVHFSGLSTLHDVINKSILPNEYGGTDGNIEDHINLWHTKLLQSREWFKQDEMYRSRLQ